MEQKSSWWFRQAQPPADSVVVELVETTGDVSLGISKGTTKKSAGGLDRLNHHNSGFY